MKRHFMLSLAVGCLVPLAAGAQHPVGLLSDDLLQTFDGYNLLFPHNQSTVFLLNNCGEIVHTWEDAPDIRPGNTVLLA